MKDKECGCEAAEGSRFTGAIWIKKIYTDRHDCRFPALLAKFQVALSALADIALSDDMTDAQRRHKARRVYDELRH